MDKGAGTKRCLGDWWAGAFGLFVFGVEHFFFVSFFHAAHATNGLRKPPRHCTTRTIHAPHRLPHASKQQEQCKSGVGYLLDYSLIVLIPWESCDAAKPIRLEQAPLVRTPTHNTQHNTTHDTHTRVPQRASSDPKDALPLPSTHILPPNCSSTLPPPSSSEARGCLLLVSNTPPPPSPPPRRRSFHHAQPSFIVCTLWRLGIPHY